MSVLIKGMKMPKSCGECQFLTYPFNVPVCSVTGETFTIPYNRSLRQVLQERKSNCPLEEVAKEVQHGRWINHGSFEVCSVCGEEQYGHDNGRYYCPNCGARMNLEKEKNER